MKALVQTAPIVLLLSGFVNSFVISKPKRIRQPPLHFAGSPVIRLNAMDGKQNVVSREESQVEVMSDSTTNIQNFVSLASDYRVDVTSSQQSEQWLLTPIADVVSDGTALAEGALANRALLQQADTVPTNDSIRLVCTYDDDNSLVVVEDGSRHHDDEGGRCLDDDSLALLLAALSRIMVQRLASRQVEPKEKYSITLPNEESTRPIQHIPSQDGVLELFQPLLSDDRDSHHVEWVEMVDKHGKPLGMVPRPLVHTLNLLHRGIGMVVAKKEDDDSVSPTALYVHRRTSTKRIFPSLYDMFVGGVSSAGEDTITTAAREVAEELGLSRALTMTKATTTDVNTTPTTRSGLSEPLFCCTVCTAYNRCVVTVYRFDYDSSQDSISWQEEEVAWGAFVPYDIVKQSAKLCIQRMVSSKTWPGEVPPLALTMDKENLVDSSVMEDYGCEGDWRTWDYVPDGLLVWEAWLHWWSQQENRSNC